MSYAAGLGQNIFGKDARQLVLADHHLDIDAEVAGVAQNLNHSTGRGTGGRRPTGDLHIDNQAFEIGGRRGFQPPRSAGRINAGFSPGGKLFGFLPLIFRCQQRRRSLFAQHSMRRDSAGFCRNLLPVRDQNGLGHALVEGHDGIAQ